MIDERKKMLAIEVSLITAFSKIQPKFFRDEYLRTHIVPSVLPHQCPEFQICLLLPRRDIAAI
jgi:hypothetical protein